MTVKDVANPKSLARRIKKASELFPRAKIKLIKKKILKARLVFFQFRLIVIFSFIGAAFSFTNTTKSTTPTTAGIKEIRNINLKLSFKSTTNMIPKSGPITPPAESIARWNPKINPRLFALALPRSKASRGDVLRPFPILSINRASKTKCQERATVINSFEIEAKEYPQTTKIFLF